MNTRRHRAVGQSTAEIMCLSTSTATPLRFHAGAWCCAVRDLLWLYVIVISRSGWDGLRLGLGDEEDGDLLCACHVMSCVCMCVCLYIH